jgi:hypothetical protein
MRVGLCIAGKAVQKEWQSTAALNQHVVHSQLLHLVSGLRAQGSLDIFFVLDRSDASDVQVQDVVRRFLPHDVRYDNSSADGPGDERRTHVSYMRLKVCAQVFARAEEHQNLRYDWLVRSRPDLYFCNAQQLQPRQRFDIASGNSLLVCLCGQTAPCPRWRRSTRGRCTLGCAAITLHAPSSRTRSLQRTITFCAPTVATRR